MFAPQSIDYTLGARIVRWMSTFRRDRNNQDLQSILKELIVEELPFSMGVVVSSVLPLPHPRTPRRPPVTEGTAALGVH